MEFDMTKMVEEIAMQAEENQEEFIFETIRPYCEDVLQMKINKEELKQILLNSMQKQQPCEDCISREETLKVMCDKCPMYNCVTGCSSYRHIEKLPSVTSQPKTGRWIEETINEWTRKVCCSECGGPPPFEHISNGDVYSAGGYGVIHKTKFCPNCGAKMEVEE